MSQTPINRLPYANIVDLEVDNLTAGSAVISSGTIIVSSLTVNSLDVLSTATITELDVSSTATIAGLTVTGSAKVGGSVIIGSTVTLSYSSGSFAFSGSSRFYTFDGHVIPSVVGLNIGDGSFGWARIYAGSGGELIWGNSSYTISQVGGSLLFSGAISLSSYITSASTTGVPIQGTSTNNDAPTGYVGEYLSHTASAALTTTVVTPIASIALTAGDWIIQGGVAYDFGAATVVTRLQGSVNNASNTFVATAYDRSYAAQYTTAGSTLSVGGTTRFVTGSARVTVPATASPQNWYLNARADFASSNANVIGMIWARRAR